jgi:tRNA threonylcarbamoyladenosine biosynthesis protein TsaB
VDEVDEHARGILPLIEGLLREGQVSLAELDGIVFGRGPGSFTGLRIACSVAKGLAYAHDLPLYPVSGLAAIAYALQTAQPLQPVLAVLDARMSQVYWALYANNQYTVQESVTNPADIRIAEQGPIVIAGVGFAGYVADMPQALQDRIQQTYTQYPAASDLIALVDAAAIQPVSIAQAQPVYIRDQVTQGAK